MQNDKKLVLPKEQVENAENADLYIPGLNKIMTTRSSHPEHETIIQTAITCKKICL